MTAPLKADVQAAERLLNAAVRRVSSQFVAAHRHERYERASGGLAKWSWRASTEPTEMARLRTEAVAMLTAAAESADLLLTAAPAKKAAARKGAS